MFYTFTGLIDDEQLSHLHVELEQKDPTRQSDNRRVRWQAPVSHRYANGTRNAILKETALCTLQGFVFCSRHRGGEGLHPQPSPEDGRSSGWCHPISW